MNIINNKNIIKSLWGGGGAFYKQFNKIVNSNNNTDCIHKNFIKFKINNILAFSLIELSIVLIIIGLLVAGITGGASLIESAKMRNFINEVNSWKQALYTFKVKYGRLPGDLNNDGFNGAWCGGDSCPNGTGKAGESYSINSFSSPYNNKAQKSDAGAYIELYLNGIIDFEPTPDDFHAPTTKFFSDLPWTFHQIIGYSKNNDWFYNIMKHSIWMVSEDQISFKQSYDDILKKLDTKIDGIDVDGHGDMNGIFRYKKSDHREGNRFAIHLIDI